MATIEELLRKTLEGATPEHEAADHDLHTEVRDASTAVQNITGGLAKLVLVPDDDLPDAIVYRLVLRFDDEDRDLKVFAVPYLGYPIRHADSLNDLRQGHCGGAGRGTLHPLFERMATLRESPLVGHLAYILRNRKSLTEPEVEAGAMNGA